MNDKTAIIFGRFQPLTKAHYLMFKEAERLYRSVFILIVQGPDNYKIKAKTPKGQQSERERKLSRNPYPVGLRCELIARSMPYLSTGNIMRLSSGSIEAAIHQIRRLHPQTRLINIDVLAGPDEYSSYNNQLSYMKDKDKYNSINVEVVLFDRECRELVSGTKLRKAIANDNYVGYKDLIAPPLTDKTTFNKLRRVMAKLT